MAKTESNELGTEDVLGTKDELQSVKPAGARSWQIIHLVSTIRINAAIFLRHTPPLVPHK
jgi:hypothetical protein